MPSQQQHAAPLAGCALIVLKAVIDDQVGNVVARDPWELRKLAEQTAQASYHTIEDFAALLGGQLRHGHPYVPFANSAQAMMKPVCGARKPSARANGGLPR